MPIPTDPAPQPHLLDDLPPWADLSTFHVTGVLTPEAVAATEFADPKQKAWLFLQASAIRERQQWERDHPNGPRFPGVYLPRQD